MRFIFVSGLLLAVAACAMFSAKPSYMVYFQERSAQLDAAAGKVVAAAARRANERPAAKVDVIGYTDSAGAPAADLLLSRQRAQAVANALVAAGVAGGRVVQVGRGQTGENPGLASRRVEIAIAGD